MSMHISTLFMCNRLLRLDNHAPRKLLSHEATFYKRHGTVWVSLTFSHKSISPNPFLLKLIGVSGTSLECTFLIFLMSALFFSESKLKS